MFRNIFISLFCLSVALLYSVDARCDQDANGDPHLLQPPIISNVQISGILTDIAVISWETNEQADSLVVYDLTTPPSTNSEYDAALVTNHQLTLTGLTECTDYYFFVRSTDIDMETTTDTNGGAYYVFRTLVNGFIDYPSTDTPLTIPDTNPGLVESVLTVEDHKTITDVNVEVNITHTWVGDLTIKLITPTGTSITLSEKRGDMGDNYEMTVFDDEASTPISSGSAPFTGSFIPEAPLGAADGISAAGDWILQVSDQSSPDSGTLDDWTLSLTLDTVCGPHAKYLYHTRLMDTCSLGGPGNGDGIWDAGEQIQASITLYHDGTDPLSGVSATVIPLTSGVTMIDDTALFNDIAVGATETTLVPHFFCQLGSSIVCGTTIDFQVDIQTNEGDWTDYFAQDVGLVTPTPFVLIQEDFDGSWGPYGNNPPSGWTIEDHGDETSPAWNDNDWHRFTKGGSYGDVARVNFLPIENSDEYLITPLFDIPADASVVNLEFDHFYNDDSSTDYGYVDYISDQNPSWVNLITYDADTADMSHEIISLITYVGETNAQIRFKYVGNFDWFWQLDNIEIKGETPGSCQMNVCATLPGEVSPLSSSFPLRIEKDSINCATTGYCLYFEEELDAAGYNIYEGTIGTWFSHANAPGNICDAIIDDLGTGERRHALTPSSQNHYYLVTGFNGAGEGTAGPAPRDAQLTCPPD